MENKDKGFSKIPDSKPDGETDVLAKLQEDLQAVKDARNEDRFLFITVVVLLLDVVFFSVLPNTGGPLALLGLELLILIPLAKRMGMQETAELLDRLINRMTGRLDNKEK